MTSDVLMHGGIQSPPSTGFKGKLHIFVGWLFQDIATANAIFFGCQGNRLKKCYILYPPVFRTFDKDNDGFVSVKEWIEGLSVFHRGTLDEQIKCTLT